MNIQRNKLNIGKARRRVRMRCALFLLMLAVMVCAFGTVLPLLSAAWPRPLVIWVQTGLSLLAFGVTSFLGLRVLDGSQTRMLRLRVLSTPHMLYLALLGALAVCPVSLLADVTEGLLGRFVPLNGMQSDPLTLEQFLPMLLKGVLLAPVCEELFFRGYFFGVMEREGEATAVWGTALMFAVLHGVSAALPGHVLLGALFALLMLRTGSILAPMLLHASFNFSILIISFLGVDGLFSGFSIVACAIRLAGSTAFVWALKRAYAARAAQETVRLAMPPLSGRDKVLLLGAVMAVIAAGVFS